MDLIQLLWAPQIAALQIAEIEEFSIFMLPPTHPSPPMKNRTNDLGAIQQILYDMGPQTDAKWRALQSEVLQFEVLKVIELNPNFLTKSIKSRIFDTALEFAESTP